MPFLSIILWIGQDKCVIIHTSQNNYKATCRWYSHKMSIIHAQFEHMSLGQNSPVIESQEPLEGHSFWDLNLFQPVKNVNRGTLHINSIWRPPHQMPVQWHCLCSYFAKSKILKFNPEYVKPHAFLVWLLFISGYSVPFFYIYMYMI